MSCNCRNSFAMFLPGNFKPKKAEEVQEKPKAKIIKRKKKPVEETQEEIKEDEQVL